jgi:general secretion pathway protein L
MSEYSNSASVQILNSFRGLWRGAAAGVGALAGDIAGPPARIPANCTIAAANGGSLAFFGGGKALAQVSLGEIAKAKRALGRRARKNLLLRMAGDKAVIKTITLPVAALDVLPAVVRNKVESLAPWPLPEAIWGHRVTGPPQAGQVTVEVGIASRKVVETVVAGLRRAGLSPSYLDMAEAPNAAKGIPVDLLGQERVTRARQTLAAAMSVIALIATGIGGYGLYRAFLTYQDMSETDARLEAIKQSLKGGGAIGDAKLAEANAIYERKKNAPPLVRILSDLTTLIPDGTWLTEIGFADSVVTIAGRGPEPAKIVADLENSGTFKSANFAAATQHDAEAGAESFTISAAIEQKAAVP